MSLERRLVAGKKTMKSFLRSGQRVITRKIGRPQGTYFFELPLGVSPNTVQIALPGSRAKDFVILLDGELVERSSLLEGLPMSSELQAKYTYNAGPYTTIHISDDKNRLRREVQSFKVSIVRWKLGVSFQFPKKIFCEAVVASNNGCDFARIVLPSTKKEVTFK